MDRKGAKAELEKASDEVLRKIGRNILLFQQVEYMLKYLVANGKVSGYISEVSENQKQHTEAIKKQTMGQLVGQYLENTHTVRDESTGEEERLSEAYMSFSFRVDSDATYYETKRQSLASIVAERNELIHHLLPRFNPDSIESCQETDQFLDQQREKLLPEIDTLKTQIESLQDGREQLAKFLNSDEGKKHINLQWLRQSRLVILLGDIAAQMARPDGWALLTSASQLIRQHAPEEVAVLNKRYGHKTLKGLILATELFDIHEETTQKGGIRVLYRLKPDYVLQ